MCRHRQVALQRRVRRLAAQQALHWLRWAAHHQPPHDPLQALALARPRPMMTQEVTIGRPSRNRLDRRPNDIYHPRCSRPHRSGLRAARQRNCPSARRWRFDAFVVGSKSRCIFGDVGASLLPSQQPTDVLTHARHPVTLELVGGCLSEYPVTQLH